MLHRPHKFMRSMQFVYIVSAPCHFVLFIIIRSIISGRRSTANLISRCLQWDALQKHTSPPYVMTLKSNGCIIFIAPLSATKVVVTSKHSLGPIQNAEVSHAQRGEYWLKEHLKRKGRSVEDLAETLWNNNWTAIAEVSKWLFRQRLSLFNYSLVM